MLLKMALRLYAPRYGRSDDTDTANTESSPSELVSDHDDSPPDSKPPLATASVGAGVSGTPSAPHDPATV